MGRGGQGVRAVSDSSLEITFMYRGIRCRERITLKPTASNIKKAERHKAAIEYSIATGTFDYASTFPGSPRAAKFLPIASLETVSGFFNRWLQAKQKHLASSTFEGYRKIIEFRVIPHFGGIMIVDLKRRNIRDWLDSLDIGNKTLRNIQSCMRSALSEAVEEELLDINPLAGWTYSRKEAPPKEDDIDPFTPMEQSAVLSVLTGQARNMMQFALWTGLRTSELVALDWADIDWLREEVMISRAMTQAAKGTAEATKTLAGRRSVKLLKPALEALRAQKTYTFLADVEVFQNPRTLQRWTGDGPIRKTMWVPAMKKAGVRYRRPYQTRHTYASMMLSAGEHPMWVAKQMGHTDWTMIARVYGRWMPHADAKAGEKAELAFSANEGKQISSAFNASVVNDI